jgi:hypothetical protein
MHGDSFFKPLGDAAWKTGIEGGANKVHGLGEWIPAPLALPEVRHRPPLQRQPLQNTTRRKPASQRIGQKRLTLQLQLTPTCLKSPNLTAFRLLFNGFCTEFRTSARALGGYYSRYKALANCLGYMPVKV